MAGNLDLAGGTVHPGPGGVLNVQGNFQANAASQAICTTTQRQEILFFCAEIHAAIWVS